jgi:hypothetical protein
VNRTAKYVLGGIAVFLVGNAIYNSYLQHNPGRTLVPTTSNPADTHYASFGSVLQSGTTPFTVALGAALGFAASKVVG